MKGKNFVKKLLSTFLVMSFINSLSLGDLLRGNYVQASEVVDSVEEVDEDAWKENVGEISLVDGNIVVTGEGVTVVGNKVLITKGGDFTVSGTLSNGYIEVNSTEKVKLRLNGVSITNKNGPAICFTDAKKSFITIEKGTTNYLTDSSTYDESLEAKGALFSNDTLEIKGSGSLYVKGNYKHGIVSDDDIIVENGDIHIDSVKDAFHANDNITISKATFNINAGSDGFESEGDLLIEDGEFNISASSDGIVAASTVTINGGTININKAEEGIESKADLIINGGVLGIYVSDDGLNAATNITFNGGKLYANSTKGDGIDSNGTIIINDGIIISEGALQPETGIDCDNNILTINGGTLIATGGSNSTPSNNAKQCSVILGNGTANNIVHIEGTSGDVLTFKPSTSYNTMLFSSPNLVQGSSYTIYSGGSVSEGEEFNGLYTGANYTEGTSSSTFTISSIVTNMGYGGPGGGFIPGGGENRPGGGGRPGGDKPWDIIELQSGEISTDKASPQYEGTSINISTTTAIGGVGDYQYQMLVNGNVIKEYSSVSSATWTPTEAGEYTITVNTKDGMGHVVSKTMNYTIEKEVEINKELKINKFSTNLESPQKSGTTIKLGVEAEGEGSLKYRFVVLKDGVNVWTRGYNSNNTAKWTPTEKGNYSVICKVKDSSGKIVSNTITYTIE